MKKNSQLMQILKLAIPLLHNRNYNMNSLAVTVTCI